jgi:hypothetical protein
MPRRRRPFVFEPIVPKGLTALLILAAGLLWNFAPRLASSISMTLSVSPIAALWGLRGIAAVIGMAALIRAGRLTWVRLRRP